MVKNIKLYLYWHNEEGPELISMGSKVVTEVPAACSSLRRGTFTPNHISHYVLFVQPVFVLAEREEKSTILLIRYARNAAIYMKCAA